MRVAEVVEERVVFFFADGIEARGAQVGHELGVFGSEADGEDHAKVEANCFLTEGDAVMGECVLIGVSDAVVGLATVAGDAGGGGEENEEIEVGWEEGVQIPGSLNFRLDGCGKVFMGHVFEYGILVIILAG